MEKEKDEKDEPASRNKEHVQPWIASTVDYYIKKGQIITKGGTIWGYNHGAYTLHAESIIRRKLTNERWPNCPSYVVEEVLRRIRNKTGNDTVEFNPEAGKFINLKNGVYTLKEQKLLPHSADYRFMYVLPFGYGPEADCPRFKQFLQEVLEEKYRPLIQEIFGYCLLTDYRFHKLFILHGSGNNGKTVLLNVLMEFLGK
ncbi:MAG: hypothetical protein AB1295_06290 [Candidatus Micrarchaeota archaeon]